jgi:hypothetical protein
MGLIQEGTALVNTQQLVQTRIEAAADAAGVTLATDTSYANTGTWRCYDEELKLICEISYNFQNGYSVFKAPGLPVGLGYVKSADLFKAIRQLIMYVQAQA